MWRKKFINVGGFSFFLKKVALPNPVTRTNDNIIPETQVSHFSFSRDGSSLITVDTRRNLVTDRTTNLKFWSWDTHEKRFIMNTRVEQPHKGNITSLIYHPTKNMAVTVGADAKFKVWVRIDRLPEERGTIYLFFNRKKNFEIFFFFY